MSNDKNTTTLVMELRVEYTLDQGVTLKDIADSIEEIIDKCREGGKPIKATLTGIPTSMEWRL